MIQAPFTQYNGITLVLSRKSRFDERNDRLLVGPARSFVDEIMRPRGLYSEGMEIRTKESISLPLREGTNRIVLAGEEALHATGYYGLDARRGYCEELSPGLHRICTYAPQDCCDIFNVEDQDDDDEEDHYSTEKDSAPTAWGNRRFWSSRDWTKILDPGAFPVSRWQQSLRIVSLGDLAGFSQCKNRDVFIDIETHPTTNTLSVIGFAVDDSPIYTLPIYDYRGNICIEQAHMVMLARLLANNHLILHNASFDLAFLAVYYRLPFSRKISDTMLMWHRLFPEAEKSLAHVMSYALNVGYHKNEGIFFPRNAQQEQKLYAYNVKDVEATRAIYLWLLEQSRHNDGLKASFADVNSAIYPYLLAGLRGIDIDSSRRREILRRNQARLVNLQRLLNILVGFDFNPGSQKQCVQYFHRGMNYEVVKKSEKTGEPSLGGDALYKLLLKHDNPVIPIILEMRKLSKSNSMLSYKPLLWPTRR